MSRALAAWLSRAVVGCYPPRWKQRYREEILDVLDQHRASPRTVLSLAGSALATHLDPDYRLERPVIPMKCRAALRSAATMLGADLAGDGIRVASITIAGQIQPGTPFSPDQIAEKYWSVVQSDGTWQSEFRFDGT